MVSACSRNAKVPADTVAVGVSDLDDADLKAAMEEWDVVRLGVRMSSRTTEAISISSSHVMSSTTGVITMTLCAHLQNNRDYHGTPDLQCCQPIYPIPVLSAPIHATYGGLTYKPM
jgi:hypothetical protein